MAELGMEIRNNDSRFFYNFQVGITQKLRKGEQTFYVGHIVLA